MKKNKLTSFDKSLKVQNANWIRELVVKRDSLNLQLKEVERQIRDCSNDIKEIEESSQWEK